MDSKIDETYIGDSQRIKGFIRDRGTNKILVLGIIEKVCITNAIVITDDLRPYNILDKQKKDKCVYLSVNHRAEQYSDGNGTYTNTIESIWVIVKQSFN